MAWWNSISDLTGDVKKGVVGVGHVVGDVAKNPLVDAGIGAFLGPGAAAAAKGVGTLIAPGGNIGNAALGGAEGYALGKAGQFVGGKLGIGGSGGPGGTPGSAVPIAGGSNGIMPGDLIGMGGSIPGTVGAGAAGASGGASGGGWLDTLKGLGQSAITNGGSLLGKLNDATGGGSGLNKVLLAAAIADAAATRKRQQDLQNQGLQYATDSYSARQPLRHQGLSMLQSQQTPDLSFLNNPMNPYTKTVTPFNVSAKTPIIPSKGSSY